MCRDSSCLQIETYDKLFPLRTQAVTLNDVLKKSRVELIRFHQINYPDKVLKPSRAQKFSRQVFGRENGRSIVAESYSPCVHYSFFLHRLSNWNELHWPIFDQNTDTFLDGMVTQFLL